MSFNYTMIKDEILSRVDIVEIIGETVTLEHKGKNYRGLCPFHKENTPSFNVNQEKQLFYCFGCNTGGDIFTFVMKHNNVSFKMAGEMLAARAGLATHKTSWADMQRIQAAKLKRKQEKGVTDKLRKGINDEYLRLCNIEQWSHKILKFVVNEDGLNRPAVQWALNTWSQVGCYLDEFLQGNELQRFYLTQHTRRLFHV